MNENLYNLIKEAQEEKRAKGIYPDYVVISKCEGKMREDLLELWKAKRIKIGKTVNGFWLRICDDKQ